MVVGLAGAGILTLFKFPQSLVLSQSNRQYLNVCYRETGQNKVSYRHAFNDFWS